MWIVVIAVVIVVGIVVVAIARRPKAGDLHSVRSYHSALGTLEHLSERAGPPSVKSVGQEDMHDGAPAVDEGDPGRQSAEGAQPERSSGGSAPRTTRATSAGASRGRRSVAPVPVRGNDAFPDPGAPLVFDDSRPRDRYRVHGPNGAPGLRTDRVQRHALESMNHRPRRGAAILLVVVALAVFGALAYVGSGRSGAPERAHSTATSASAPISSSNGPGRTSHPGTSSGPGGRGGGHTKAGRTTPTTAPKQYLAATSTSTTATYSVSAASYQIGVAVTGPCWVEAVTVSTGSAIWQGVLQAGADQVIAATGSTIVHLGAATASLTVDRTPVVLPKPLRTPFTVTFQSPTTAVAPVTSPTQS